MEIRFAKAPSGWTLTDEAMKELAQRGSEESADYCCSIFNSDGSLQDKITISADGRASAVSKCMDEATLHNCPGGTVKSGPC